MGAVKRNVNQSNRQQGQQHAAQQQAAQQKEVQEQTARAQSEGQEVAPEPNRSAEELKTRRSCLHKQLRKTKFCMYHLQGVCMFGDNCAFAHNCSELQGAPDLRKTRLCKAFAAGNCKDIYCTFAHGEEELHSTDLFYKKTLCIWYEKGRCRNSDQCRFAHGTKELRVRGGAVPPRAGGQSEKPGARGGAKNSGTGVTAGRSAGAGSASKNAGYHTSPPPNVTNTSGRDTGNNGAATGPVGRAGGHQALNNNAAEGNLMGDWALLGNHIPSAPNANASGTANMLYARHLAEAAAMAASQQGNLTAAAANSAAVQGAVRNGGLVGGQSIDRQPQTQQPVLLEPMFVQTEKPNNAGLPYSLDAADTSSVMNKLMQVQQLQQQLLIHQQLQKQLNSFAVAGRPSTTGMVGPQESAASQLEQYTVSDVQVESLQRASAAALAAAGAIGSTEGTSSAVQSSVAEGVQPSPQSDLEKLTQSVVALTMQLSRFEKQVSMHGGNNGTVARPTGSATQPQITPEDQAMLMNAAMAANAAAAQAATASAVTANNLDAGADMPGNVWGLPMPPWPVGTADNAALLKQMINPDTALLGQIGAAESCRNGSSPYSYTELLAAVQALSGCR